MYNEVRVTNLNDAHLTAQPTVVSSPDINMRKYVWEQTGKILGPNQNSVRSIPEFVRTNEIAVCII